MTHVNIITDGAAKGNPDGPGGYGTIVRIFDDNYEVLSEEEFAEGFPITSNNRMEMLAVIVGLESLTEPSDVVITSDSKYVVDTFDKGWIWNWLKNGWKTANGDPVKNKDLWSRMLDAKKPHKVTFNWVKGHNGHPDNERCDFLASSMGDGLKLVKGEDNHYHLEGEENTKEKYVFTLDMKCSDNGEALSISVNGSKPYASVNEMPEELQKQLSYYLPILMEDAGFI